MGRDRRRVRQLDESARQSPTASCTTFPTSWGTAVNVQAMVFGNMGDDCATGVCFTRDPSTGENIFYGEYLVNAQGEDVVAGIRTPQPMAKAARQARRSEHGTGDARRIRGTDAVREKLEQHYRDMQDMEFTVQKDKLYMLQTRNGKRTAAASLRIAVEMANEGLIDQARSGQARQPGGARPVAAPDARPEGASARCSRKGLPASPGAASGHVVFTADEAESRAGKGEAVILVRIETSPEDIHGMHAARGILTDARRHDESRRRGGARHGPGLRGRRRRHLASTTARRPFGRRQDGALPATSSPSTARPAKCSSATSRSSSAMSNDFHADGVGRQGAPAQGARQRGDAARRRDRAQIRRRGHRPVPHRAHVLRADADQRGARR